MSTSPSQMPPAPSPGKLKRVAKALKAPAVAPPSPPSPKLAKVIELFPDGRPRYEQCKMPCVEWKRLAGILKTAEVFSRDQADEYRDHDGRRVADVLASLVEVATLASEA